MVYTIILNYNSSKETLALLDNLKKSELGTNVLVIDNNSNDFDKEVLKANIAKNSLIINEKNLGYAGGNNIGIDIALKNKAEYIWILNPDIRIEKKTLPNLLKLIRSQPKIAAVGPRIRSRLDKKQIFSDGGVVFFDERCHADLINYDASITENPPSVNFNIDYVDGSCILINSDAILELGLLPQEYFLYFEETDWCTNAKRNGWLMGIDSSANAYNLKSERNKNYIYYINRNRLLFAKKYHPSYRRVYFYYLKLIFEKVYRTIRFKKKYPLLKWEIKGILDGIKIFS